ncbi:MAG: Coenzyme F420 hydrogenase/dehydrogenase, beta subunit C-terminal domain [Verrucomicrobiales bacterium]|nr:Coenzyme F420 hydrogenase/dehydrogenase, beta subunit C-terminal domain [Verrucomicrobiales bacterium]
MGNVIASRVGHADDERVRRAGASGGVMTAVLLHLLETGRIDGAVVARQDVPASPSAAAVIATTRGEIMAAAQSVYVPVSILERLPDLEPGKNYAMTALPEEAILLRQLQRDRYAPALQIKWLLGPYTGTALKPGAIRCLLRASGVRDSDVIKSLKWRAGEWPGYLEIVMASGKVVRSKKVYYNFLIPFFITRGSLFSMDFTNEFCDLAVGDAWSPVFERLGGGHSVVLTRGVEMEKIILEMRAAGKLRLEDIELSRASEMHGHMLDFKKRGGYIRSRVLRRLGFAAPDYGVRPVPLPLSRWLVEAVVSSLFLCCGNRVARKFLEFVPEAVIGPVFNRLRLAWKAFSKPTKRKGLANLRMIAESGLDAGKNP